MIQATLPHCERHYFKSLMLISSLCTIDTSDGYQNRTDGSMEQIPKKHRFLETSPQKTSHLCRAF